MTTKRRASRLSPEERTVAILDAARSVFAERGFSDTVMSEIAERAGVVEGSIYRYFRNKRELMFRMAEEWFEEMIAGDETTLRAVSGARNQLRFIVHRHLRSIHDHPDLSRLVFQHLRPEPDYRSTRLFALNREYAARVTEVVNRGIEAGEIRSGVSPALVRDIIFGSIEHRTWAFLRDEGNFDVDRLADEVVSLVWEGLAAVPKEQGLHEILGRIEGHLTREV
jgi:TetR/AcrR family transcriptional regulator, fatty acid metabolism regulator protein